MPRTRRLARSFYNRPTLTVASELIGKTLVYVTRDGRLSGRIVEVEAYIGEDDPACHAAPGPTKRNAIMYGPPGHAYIYFIYGMYNCLNIVTEKRGFPAAVLIRAAEPVGGVEIMCARSMKSSGRLLMSGPGRLCRAFGLTTAQSGMDICGGELFVEDTIDGKPDVRRSRRIGIRKGTEKLWRFCDANSDAVSGVMPYKRRPK